MSTKIKICGITSAKDALAAIDAGADFLGLIFVDASPRCVKEEAAREIIASVEGRAQMVGVFKDQDHDFVDEISQRLALDFVQCHGNETINYVRNLHTKAIKVIEIEGLSESGDYNANPLDESRKWADGAKYLLIDRPKALKDELWYRNAARQIFRQLPLSLPYFFAGGLNAENVGWVVNTLRPFAVDVASSVESAPGVKDAAKMKDFCNAVRNIEGETSCAP
jgi:phosphoribosylanthranilate isomerase